jgi:nucleoside 2-deoxyribosyltransferase
MAKVFVSYSKKDRNWAKTLARQLEERGFSPWLDERDVQTGTNWEDEVKKAVADSDALIAVLGEGKPSPKVLVEVGMALGQQKPVMPVVVGKYTDPGYLSSISKHEAIKTNNADAAARQIVRAVNAR